MAQFDLFHWHFNAGNGRDYFNLCVGPFTLSVTRANGFDEMVEELREAQASDSEGDAPSPSPNHSSGVMQEGK